MVKNRWSLAFGELEGKDTWNSAHYQIAGLIPGQTHKRGY